MPAATAPLIRNTVSHSAAFPWHPISPTDGPPRPQGLASAVGTFHPIPCWVATPLTQLVREMERMLNPLGFTTHKLPAIILNVPKWTGSAIPMYSPFKQRQEPAVGIKEI